MFGLFDDIIDSVVKLPGKIVESGAEIVTRIPEIPIRMVDGAINGVEKGVDKVGEAFDDLDSSF